MGNRRWDEPVQRHLTGAGLEAPWYDVAADRAIWNSLELASIARAQRSSVQPPGYLSLQTLSHRGRSLYSARFLTSQLVTSQRGDITTTNRAAAVWKKTKKARACSTSLCGEACHYLFRLCTPCSGRLCKASLRGHCYRSAAELARFSRLHVVVRRGFQCASSPLILATLACDSYRSWSMFCAVYRCLSLPPRVARRASWSCCVRRRQPAMLNAFTSPARGGQPEADMLDVLSASEEVIGAAPVEQFSMKFGWCRMPRASTIVPEAAATDILVLVHTAGSGPTCVA